MVYLWSVYGLSMVCSWSVYGLCRDSLHPVEAAGLGLWLVCWIMENLADMQKLSFVKLAKKNGDLRTAVLGHPPYNTHK